MTEGEQYLTQAERELNAASAARTGGNAGKMRVCARRAAGAAITWLLLRHPCPGWGTDAVTQLLHLQNDPGFSQEARDAAKRLTLRISADFTYPSSGDPIEDARAIIHAITAKMNAVV